MDLDQTGATSSNITAELPATTSNLSAGGNIGDKFNIAKSKKAAGDEAFKNDDLPGALRHYHEALLYLKGLDKNATQRALGQPVPPPPPVEAVSQSAEDKQKTEVDFLAEKIYANMSQSHLKKGNWKRAMETADQALSHNPKNFKASFRKARALKELGYFEKAEKLLEELIKNGDPNDKAACEEELASVREKDKEVTEKHNQKMKGFLNRDKVDLGKD